MNSFKSLLLLLLLVYFISFFIGALESALGIVSSVNLPEKQIYTIFTVVIVAPVVETMLNQYLVYELLVYKLKNKIICISLVSGMIFGLLHLGSLLTIINTGCIGFMFQLWFILLARKYGTLQAFLQITGVHALRNAISVFVVLYTNYVA